jgi:hypothetical protein
VKILSKKFTALRAAVGSSRAALQEATSAFADAQGEVEAKLSDRARRAEVLKVNTEELTSAESAVFEKISALLTASGVPSEMIAKYTF